MKNLTEYNAFKNKARLMSESKLNEGAQLFDNAWRVRTRVEIPTSLINAYVKKVQNDTGENIRQKWSDQELAEEITNYVTSAYLTVENLPVTIVTAIDEEPKVQVQEEMPEETQVQSPDVDIDVQSDDVAMEVPQAQVQGQAQGQPQGQGQAQGQPQRI